MSRLSIFSDTRYRTRFLLFLLLFALIFVRYCCYGIEYYHQLDDYIQYHNYAQGENPFGTVLSLGLLAARPLAGCADVLLWSRFFSVMIIAVAILSAMFAASALLLQWVFARHFGTGYVFLAVMTLLPLGIEGTYWVSASSRIVTGLFFASASLFFFERWCSVGKRVNLVFYMISQLFSFGFYEQALVFSLTATALIAAFHLNSNRKRALCGLFSLLNTAVFFLITSLFANSTVYGSRLGIISVYGHYYWSEIFPNVSGQVRDAFIKGGFYTSAKGLWRGVKMLIEDRKFLYSAVILLLSGFLFTFTKNRGINDNKNYKTALITGLLLTLAPISIFFVIDNAWFSLRCTVMSFCGIALITDSLFTVLVSKTKRKETVTALTVSCFALLCCIASVSEIRDYRDTNANDRAFIDVLAAQVETDNLLNSNLRIAVLNAEPSYLPNQNFFYHEHIHGVTESEWALTGALERKAGPDRPTVTPMPRSPAYRPWNFESSQLDGFDAVYLYGDGKLTPVRAEKAMPDRYLLFDGQKLIGHVWEEDRYGYLELEG